MEIGEPQVASEVEPIEDPVPRELEPSPEKEESEDLLPA
jgi:hypothetical protein